MAVRERIFDFVSPKLSILNIPWCCWPTGQVHYQVMRVNPLDITHEIKDGIVPLKDNTKFWRRARVFQPHKAVVDMFAHGIHYTDTDQYRAMIAKIDAGSRAYWCESREDVNRYFIELTETYDSMKRCGYRRSEDRTYLSEDWCGTYPNEILVSIDGQKKMYLERGGTHRLSIARLLELREVYVAVIREYVGSNTA